jgi:hypothetical protein
MQFPGELALLTDVAEAAVENPRDNANGPDDVSRLDQNACIKTRGKPRMHKRLAGAKDFALGWMTSSTNGTRKS